MKKFIIIILCLLSFTGISDVMYWGVNPNTPVYNNKTEKYEYGSLDIFISEDPINVVTYDGENSFLGARVVAKRSDGSLIGVIANKIPLTDDEGH